MQGISCGLLKDERQKDRHLKTAKQRRVAGQ